MAIQRPSRPKFYWLSGTVILRVVAVLLFFNGVLSIQWFGDSIFRENTTIFYWQNSQISRYLVWSYFLTCALPPILVLIVALISLKKERSQKFWATLIITYLVAPSCFLVNYSLIFAGTSVNHIGTQKLNGTIYQVAKVAKYDEESVYYLGVCDQTGYWCAFRDIYHIYLFRVNTAEFHLSENGQYLIVRVNEDDVYTYDGVTEHCRDGEGGYCPPKLR